MNTYLIDTNILIYAYNTDSELHEPALNLMQEAINGEMDAYIADKTLYEFYAIVTDNKRVENPVEPSEAIEVIEFIRNSKIEVILPTIKTISILTQLLEKYNIRKQKIFDAVLAAIGIENNIKIILTRNDKDFDFYEEIAAINPFL